MNIHVLDPSVKMNMPDLWYQWGFVCMSLHKCVCVHDLSVIRCTILPMHMCGFITLLVNF